MDERTRNSLLYRIKQLENNIERAHDSAKETELTLQGVLGHLKITKYDFETLRRLCE